jgi:hypothetical protein
VHRSYILLVCAPTAQSITIEHVCLVHAPPPLLELAAAPASRLRELRLRCCQIRHVRDEVRDLTRLTSLDLSGRFEEMCVCVCV